MSGATDNDIDSCHQSVQEDLNETIVRRFERSNKGVPEQQYRETSRMPIVAEPTTYDETVNSPKSASLIAFMEEEMKPHHSNSTWTAGALSEGQKAVASKWLYKRKLDENGRVTRYKFGTDYDQIFAQVTKKVTFRTLLTIATCRHPLVKHDDIKTAYLYGTLSETVYMHHPKGYETGASAKVCHLKKSNYGLKQSGRI